MVSTVNLFRLQIYPVITFLAEQYRNVSYATIRIFHYVDCESSCMAFPFINKLNSNKTRVIGLLKAFMFFDIITYIPNFTEKNLMRFLKKMLFPLIELILHYEFELCKYV